MFTFRCEGKNNIEKEDSKMKIGVIGAVPFNLIFGGGETQTINTMKSLQDIGVDIGYYDFWNKDYKCDILHIFGCHDWLYKWAFLAKQKGIKIALSTIAYAQEKMTLKRWLYDRFDRLLPLDTTYRLNRKLIQLADILLPNSNEEAKYLDEILGAGNKKKIVIPNAADLRYKNGDAKAAIETYGFKEYVLCVGKIEPRKNQLQLVRALANTDIPLIVLGSFIPNAKWYYDEVISYINKNSNMKHIEFLPYDSEMLSSLYAGAKVHALLGRNETPGIVNLEAGLAGANLVVGDCKPVREYLKDHALYADFNSISDIQCKIKEAYQRKRNPETARFIENNYTWKIVAQKTLDGYKQIIEN